MVRLRHEALSDEEDGRRMRCRRREAEQSHQGDGQLMNKTGKAGCSWRDHGHACRALLSLEDKEGPRRRNATHGKKEKEEQGGKIRAKWAF